LSSAPQSAQVLVAGRPAQLAQARGVHGRQSGWPVRAKLHFLYLPQTALGIR
jgi:hypothetical protein